MAATMRARWLTSVAVSVAAFLVVPIAICAQDANLPHLEQRGVTLQLVVDGKPFLMLAGELHNSSSSSLEYMKPIWPRLAAIPLNTVLTPISWELVEPADGKYDFTLIDGLLAQAREQRLRVVLLWLASWKNGMSSYAPVWVKQDTKRFPRVVLRNNEANILSTIAGFSDATRDADARAFAAVMQHIREVDIREHTVVMMQVENEVGVLGDSRDHSSAAEQAFAAAVPPQLIEYLKVHRDTLDPELCELWRQQGEKTSGTWAQVFGDTPRADEIFMAWNYARYIQAVTTKGKATIQVEVLSRVLLISGRQPAPPSTFIPPTSTCLTFRIGQIVITVATIHSLFRRPAVGAPEAPTPSMRSAKTPLSGSRHSPSTHSTPNRRPTWVRAIAPSPPSLPFFSSSRARATSTAFLFRGSIRPSSAACRATQSTSAWTRSLATIQKKASD